MKKPTDNQHIDHIVDANDMVKDKGRDHIPDAGKMVVKHTNGPWKWITDGPYKQRLVATDGFEVLAGEAHGRGIGADNLIVGNANAQLIAAAPDLLAACKRFTENIDRWLEDGDPAGPDESESIYNQAVDAIRKAEGTGGEICPTLSKA